MILDEKDIIREEKLWAKQKGLIERKQKIAKEKRELRPKLFTTTKLLIFFLFVNCTIIEIFTGWATIQSLNNSLITGQYADFSPLIALIGAVVGEVMGFAIYAVKSTKENTAGGIIYDQTMNNRHDITQDILNNYSNNRDNSNGTVG